jgi:hypothetical protein
MRTNSCACAVCALAPVSIASRSRPDSISDFSMRCVSCVRSMTCVSMMSFIHVICACMCVCVCVCVC